MRLKAKGEIEEAIAAYQMAIQLNPNGADTFMNLGDALKDRGRLDEAIDAFRAAVRLKPDVAKAHNQLGTALYGRRRLDEAIATYRTVVRLKPDHAAAHSNLGIALCDAGQLDEAIAECRTAIRLKSDLAEAHSNLGNALGDHGRLDEAISAYRDAIALKGDLAGAHWNLGTALLMKGDYAQGWPEYEWRWKVKELPSPRDVPQPLWDGGDLAGRTILLRHEQGFGDTIQFLRYVPLVIQRGGKVIVECQQDLWRLLQSNAREWQVVAEGESLPAFDVHCPLGSLPLAFGTTLQDIPAEVPYLSADDAAAARWRDRLGGDSGALNVGLVWAGNPAFRGDRLRSPRELSLYSPLAAVKNVRFFSLQKGEAAKQAAHPPAGMNLTDWTSDFGDFADTAALIANLDLVISSDTAVAHLAGAMGKPVWVILPLSPDWRWMLDRSDNPWYPTMRLFRQTKVGQWTDVIEQVAGALALRILLLHC